MLRQSTLSSSCTYWKCKVSLPPPLLLLLLLLLPGGALGYSSGAPDSRCVSMVPGHGLSLNSYTDPFRVSLSSATYSPLQLLTVTIESAVATAYIRGFMIEARAANSRDSGDTRGFFIAGSDSKTACNSGAITHSFSTDRSSVTVSWRAPPSPQGDIVFRATVVRVYSDFYTAVDSPVLSPLAPTTTTTTTTTTPTTTTTTPTTTTPTTTPPPTTTTTSTSTTTATTTPPTTTTTFTAAPTTTTSSSGLTSRAADSSVTTSRPSTGQWSPSPEGGTTHPATTATAAETNTGPVAGAGTVHSHSSIMFLLLLLMMMTIGYPLLLQ